MLRAIQSLCYQEFNMHYQVMLVMCDMDMAWWVPFPPLFRLVLSFLIINDEIM
jgi:hypothetical protein